MDTVPAMIRDPRCPGPAPHHRYRPSQGRSAQDRPSQDRAPVAVPVPGLDRRRPSARAERAPLRVPVDPRAGDRAPAAPHRAPAR